MKPQGLFGLIASDIRAKAQWIYGDVTARTILKTLFTDGTCAMIMYRCMQTSRRLHFVPLAMMFNKINVVCGQCIIGRGADFGPGFVLIHSQGVVINSAVRGGSDVKLEHQVTIGAEKNAAPVLGDNVFIGAGAKIIGGVHVGCNVRIGANAVVVNDIPDGTTAVGIPARAIEKSDGR